MNINDFFPQNLAGLAIIVGAALSILKWIMKKEVSEPIEKVQKTDEELTKAQKESNKTNMKRFDELDRALGSHEVELARHDEQISAIKKEHDK